MQNEKTPDPSNTKEQYRSELVKRSEIIFQQPKTIENPSIVDLKLFFLEHPKTLHKLSNIIKQAQNVSQVSGAEKYSHSTLYSETKKSEKCLDEKNAKITKQLHAYKGYSNTYNVEILNSFNLELQLRY